MKLCSLYRGKMYRFDEHPRLIAKLLKEAGLKSLTGHKVVQAIVDNNLTFRLERLQ